jgi:SAM-dependent methyltransferase
MLKKVFQAARRIVTRHSSLQPENLTPSESSHPFDLSTGLDTGGLIVNQQHRGHPHDPYGTPYYASPPSLVQAMLDRWLATPGRLSVENYTFIDFGSGKGRVVLIASRLPFRKCIGVEVDAELSAIAAQNFTQWQQSGNAVSPLEAISQEATNFEFPAGPCLVYLFNPFASEVLALLLERIARSFANRPGQLDLLYVNAEFRDLLDRHPGFTPLWEMPVKMSEEDASADLLNRLDESGNRAYSVEGQEPCAAWRFSG